MDYINALKTLPRERVLEILGGRARYFARVSRRKESRLLWLTNELAKEPLNYGRTQELQQEMGVSPRAFSYYMAEIKKRGRCVHCGQMIASRIEVDAERDQVDAELKDLLKDGVDVRFLLQDPTLPAETSK
jgi:hypothetical protein